MGSSITRPLANLPRNAAAKASTFSRPLATRTVGQRGAVTRGTAVRRAVIGVDNNRPSASKGRDRSSPIAPACSSAPSSSGVMNPSISSGAVVPIDPTQPDGPTVALDVCDPDAPTVPDDQGGCFNTFGPVASHLPSTTFC